MRFSKITAVLQALDKGEIKRLDDYLNCPYFKVPAGAIDLFNYLKSRNTNGGHQELEEQTIAQSIPGMNTRNKQDITAARLFSAIENFLVHEKVQKNKYIQTQCRLSVYKKLHLFELFDQEYNEALKDISKNSEQDFDVFYQRHLITELAFTGFDAVLNRTSNNDLHPVTQTLDTFYALKKLRYHCELLNREKVLGTHYDKENMDYVLETLSPFNNTQYPFAYLFSSIYRMLSVSDYAEALPYYERIKTYLADYNQSDLSPHLNEVHLFAKNFCMYWYSKGNEAAGRETLWWIDASIKYNRFSERNKLQPATFRNAVALAIHNKKEPNWIKSFINQWAPFLPEESKGINQAFAQAQYFFYIKDFSNAMPLFQQAQVKDEPIFNAIVRRWQFMCMYEQNSANTDLLLDFLDAYEKYIQRNTEELHSLKRIFAQNIAYGRRLVKAANNACMLKQIKEQLTQEPYFAGKDWVLEQLL